MQEAEVSLRVAMYYISNGLTDDNVMVSIDGAHIKTGNTVHFDIWSFLEDNDFIKIDREVDKWQGEYGFSDYGQHIIISSKPGEGDVVIRLKEGKTLFIESKKGKADNRNQEYPLMCEAIGQLMTGRVLMGDIIPAVAVPYSKKSHELAVRWSEYPQIKNVGIRFILVKNDGNIEII